MGTNNGENNGTSNNGRSNNGRPTPVNNSQNCPETEKINGMCLPDCSKTTPFGTLCNLVCDDTCSKDGDCFPCDGKRCTDDNECGGSVCNGSVCQEESHCWDGVLADNETGVDCGGDCQGCGAGEPCKENSDCTGGLGCHPKKQCEEVFESCEAAFRGVNNPSSGIYLIDVGNVDPVPMFCNPRLDGGAALLLVAKKDSQYWGTSIKEWENEETKGNLPTKKLKFGMDQRTAAYSKLKTNAIFLCLLEVNNTKCFKFELKEERTLMSFFTESLTHTQKFETRFSDVPGFVSNFLGTYGYGRSQMVNVDKGCFWLGINFAPAKIGLMGDVGDGCGDGSDRLNDRFMFNDIGFGLGMDFGRASGSHKGQAGITRYVMKKNGGTQGAGTDPYLVGPWAVFAK